MRLAILIAVLALPLTFSACAGHRVRVRERWPFSTWFLLTFLAVWSGGMFCATASGLRRGSEDAGHMSDVMVPATLGTVVAVGLAVAIARKRRFLEVRASGLRDVRVLWPPRRTPYDRIGKVRLAPPRIEVVTDSMTVGMPRSASAWPELVATILRANSEVELEMPTRLARRLRALRNRESAAVTISISEAPPLRHAFLRLYSGPLVAMCPVFVVFTGIALALAHLSGDGLVVVAIAWSPFVLILLALCADYLVLRLRYRVELHPNGIAIRDGLGRTREIRWGELVDADFASEQGGGSVTLHTAQRAYLFRRELSGVDGLEHAVKDALKALDRELAHQDHTQ
jgi:hypothetical protein